MTARTGAERYFEKQRQDPAYDADHREAAATIRSVDQLIRSLDRRREECGFSKAELARQAGLPAEAVRRLFTMRSPNPTATTLFCLARALYLDLVAQPQPSTVRRARNSSR